MKKPMIAARFMLKAVIAGDPRKAG